jgi:enamine deaminase RidA (YjgF/YER057c/UK114 family)
MGRDGAQAGAHDGTDAHVIRVTPDPAADYRISPGFRVGGLVFVSGQTATSEDGSVVGVGDFDAQVDQVFARLRRVLEAGGSSLEQVVKVTIYVTDMANLPRVVAFRERFFTPPYPADTLVAVQALARPEHMLEIDAIAVTGEAHVR